MPSTAPLSARDAGLETEPDHPAEAPAVRRDRAIWIVIVVATALFWLISTSWRPWDLFDRAGFSADFYDEQARSFLRGRLAVRPEVPGPEGFLIDGQTYLYYGPFLAIVRMPLALFGDLFVGRMVRLSMLIAFVVLGRWSARLATAARRVVATTSGRPLDDRHWPIVMFVAAVVFSPALFAAGWITVYHETEIWALTFAVIAITLIVEWAAGEFASRSTLLWACAAIFAATMTRAPIGLGLAFGMGCLGLGLAWRSRTSNGKEGWVPIAGGVAPLVAYAVINFAKFGTLFSVPGDRQLLSLTNPTRAAFFDTTGGSFFSAQFLPTTLTQYLRPDTIRFERLVPGIRFGPLAENYGSLDVETVTPASSLPVSATLLVILAAIGVVWLAVSRGRTWLAVIGAASIGAAPSFLIGFIANRYLIDMLPPLIAAAAIGVWVVAATDRRRGSLAAGSVLVVWGAWVNAALATWTIEFKSPGFVELRSDVDSALFGGGDVGLLDTGPGEAVPRDGLIGIGSECSGVYIAEQGRWVSLERMPGVYETTGIIDASIVGPVRLAQTSAWTLDVISAEGGALSAVYSTPTGPDSFSLPIDAQRPIEYRVVIDPITTESTITLNGNDFLLPGQTRDSVGLDGIGPVADFAPERLTPLCNKLVSRRDD